MKSDSERTALSKALALGLAGEVERVRLGEYRVPSTSQPGVRYTVHVDGDSYECSCKASRHPACVHRAAVYLAKVEHNAKVNVLAVKPPVQQPAESSVRRVAFV